MYVQCCGSNAFPGSVYPAFRPLDMAGVGKRFTIKTHCVKFVEDDSTFEAPYSMVLKYAGIW